MGQMVQDLLKNKLDAVAYHPRVKTRGVASSKNWVGCCLSSPGEKDRNCKLLQIENGQPV
ncbi:hypothetical protein BTH50_03345 [Lactobacillus delbrueckii subsp. bulgaricus]|nr:hypothetical protein [Lactobacillus delbrueckii subsp. bulgaricus]MBT8850653.1 hypothetical protein [Lactobacillus delbrueckii subsp. bulgaricus]